MSHLNTGTDHASALDEAHAQAASHGRFDAGVGDLLFQALFLGFGGEDAEINVFDLVFGRRLPFDEVGEALLVLAEFGEVGLGGFEFDAQEFVVYFGNDFAFIEPFAYFYRFPAPDRQFSEMTNISLKGRKIPSASR